MLLKVAFSLFLVSQTSHTFQTHFLFLLTFLLFFFHHSCISQLAIDFSLFSDLMSYRAIKLSPGFTQDEVEEKPRNDLLRHIEGDKSKEKKPEGSMIAKKKYLST